MNMQQCPQQKRKKVFSTLVLASVVVLSFTIWLAMSTHGWAQAIPPESIALSTYDQGAPTIAIPFFREGTLFLSHVKKPMEGATTTTEVSRRIIGQCLSSRRREPSDWRISLPNDRGYKPGKRGKRHNMAWRCER